MPCDYRDYPANWKSEIVPRIRERSRDCCEWCGVRNRERVERGEGERRIIKIVLTVAHLDHDLAHNDGMDSGGPALPLRKANLVHLCQRCHNRHDAKARKAHRIQRRDRESGQMSLEGVSP